MKWNVTAAVSTNRGKVRTNNEDHYELCGIHEQQADHADRSAEWSGTDSSCLFAVCDGMGGEDKGEWASFAAVNCLHACRIDEVHETAKADVKHANRIICDEIEKNGGKRIGTTVAALYIDGGKAIACNIGDSRIYLLRRGKLRQLTVDHNRSRTLVELGVLTPEQAEKHPSRHELTQHLGIFPDEQVIEPSFGEEIALSDGDKFLLCSDGLTDMVSDSEISAVMSATVSAAEIVQKLTEAALLGGGKDNITVLAVLVGEKRQGFWEKLLGSVSKGS